MKNYGRNGNRDIVAKGDILYETDTFENINFKAGVIYYLTQATEYDYVDYPSGYYIYTQVNDNEYSLQRLDKPLVYLTEFQKVGVEFSIPKEKIDAISICYDTLLILDEGDIAPSVFRLQSNVLGTMILYTADSTDGLKYQLKISVDWHTGQATGTVTEVQSGGGTDYNYTSLERLDNYLYQVTFDSIPEYNPNITSYAGGCSSFVRDGKLYRNLDFTYDNTAEFIVKCKDFTGMAFINGLVDGNIKTKEEVGQLPYHINDGVNKNGIMVSSHILYNDWSYSGAGNKDKDITLLPYYILTELHSMADINSVLGEYLANIKVPNHLAEKEYLMQYIVTDGTTTYAIIPPTSGGSYVLQNITNNPKLTNFRWVSNTTVDRHNLQTRPNGVERWNAITESTQLSDLRFTKAYESADRLSEFIGVNGTTKDSTDAQLESLYNTAHTKYLSRTRNGETWQTCHSVVYNKNGIESLYIQENYDKDYFAGGSGVWGSITGNINTQTDLINKLNKKIDTDQTTANAGKALIVGNDGNVKPANTATFLKRNTAYAVGNMVYSENLSVGEFLVCTTAGTTGATEPTWGGYETETTDGTAKFLRMKFARNDKLSMPGSGAVNLGFTSHFKENNNNWESWYYTPPSDGFVCFAARLGTGTASSDMAVHQGTLGFYLGKIVNIEGYELPKISLAVKKGVSVRIGCRNISYTTTSLYFVPAASAE